MFTINIAIIELTFTYMMVTNTNWTISKAHAATETIMIILQMQGLKSKLRKTQ